MPLRDHFRPPLFPRRRWESFHATWAVAIAKRLNGGRLPGDYFAEVQVHVGARVEVDVGTFHALEGIASEPSSNGSVATLTAPAWIATQATWELPANFPDSVEVQIFRDEGGPTLVAAIELISPANKDRPANRRDFTAKCCSYLQQGVGLVVIDVVTNRHANLHNELAAFLGAGVEARFAEETQLYAVAYRPVHRPDADRFEAWPGRIALGEVLPSLPLPLGTAGYVQLELEATYEEAFQAGRLS